MVLDFKKGDPIEQERENWEQKIRHYERVNLELGIENSFLKEMVDKLIRGLSNGA
jgi:hypothetical protein